MPEKVSDSESRQNEECHIYYDIGKKILIGYWRQQMDHICAHLKAFAHNNAEFRAIISEPKLGKINSANVDIDSNWCTLRVTFPIRSASVKETSFKSSTSQLEKSSQVKSRLTNQEYDLMEAANAGRGSSLDDDSATETGSCLNIY